MPAQLITPGSLTRSKSRELEQWRRLTDTARKERTSTTGMTVRAGREAPTERYPGMLGRPQETVQRPAGSQPPPVASSWRAGRGGRSTSRAQSWTQCRPRRTRTMHQTQRSARQTRHRASRVPSLERTAIAGTPRKTLRRSRPKRAPGSGRAPPGGAAARARPGAGPTAGTGTGMTGSASGRGTGSAARTPPGSAPATGIGTTGARQPRSAAPRLGAALPPRQGAEGTSPGRSSHGCSEAAAGPAGTAAWIGAPRARARCSPPGMTCRGLPRAAPHSAALATPAGAAAAPSRSDGPGDPSPRWVDSGQAARGAPRQVTGGRCPRSPPGAPHGKGLAQAPA
mmetsp:Transcript_23934/g.57054  ORF Transcript_23934/g.57054 Transcript_23934/m.57054 type:complete len:340 (-) Transcript_23934:1132-2151(-)